MTNITGMGARIRAARQSKGQTQSSLAEQIKSTAATIGRIERGESDPRALLLMRLSDALGQWPEFFLTGRAPAFDLIVTIAEKQSPADLNRLVVDTSALINGLVDEK